MTNQPTLPILQKKCFKCQGYGHIASECPRVITIVENEDVEEEEEESENEEIEEHVEYADEG